MPAFRSRRQECAHLAAVMRAEGKSWSDIANDFRARYRINTRKAMRWAHGLTQQQVADEWNDRWPDDPKTAQSISLWESWPEKGHEPSLPVLDRLARVYGCFIGDLLADFTDHGADAGATLRLPSTSRRNTSDADQGRATSNDHLAPLTRGLHKSAGFTPTPSRGQAVSVDGRLIDAHRETEEAFASLYRSVDPLVGMEPAIAYADSLLGTLDHVVRDSDRVALGSVAAGVHAQVGLWACHMDRPQLAYRFLSTACDLAANVGDAHLYARTLGAFSYLFSSAPRGGHGGQPERALQLLDQALALVDRGDTFTKGWLATWRADQHAALGHVSEARRDMRNAQRWLDVFEDDHLDGFFARRTYGYGMASHLDSVRGLVHAMSGNARESTEAFNRVLATAPNMRRRIGTYAHRALADVEAREPERACSALDRAVTLAMHQNYGMGLARAIGVRTRFDPAWSSLAAVRELDDHLAMASTR